MSRVDIIIFGATGFTGRKAVEEIVRISKKIPLSWGVAGRSKGKLEEILAQVGNITGEDLSKTTVVVADVKDDASLLAMARQAKVVANFCGPYRFYGEPVVKACLEARTHHLDVSGEPEFIESQQLKYDEQARQNGVYVVSACGFDSVPNDMGVMFLKQHFDGTLNSVESYLSMNVPWKYQTEAIAQGVINYGTWASAVNSVRNWKELTELRKKLYTTPMPTFKPKLLRRSMIHTHDSKYCIPFLGADASIVYRSQRHLYERQKERPIQFKPYVKMNSLFTTLCFMFVGALLYVMSQWSITRSLLLKYPRVFSLTMSSHQGPMEVVTTNTTFQFDLYGEGWAKGADIENTKPDKKIFAQIKGVNPGYGATVTAILFCAIAVLHEKDKMPSDGGVLTTGVAFKDTSLIKNLNENNLTFEIVEN